MKIWNSYGSEHSANLIMIGTFKDAGVAERAKEVIDGLTEFTRNAGDDEFRFGRYSDGALDLLKRVNFHSVGPGELEQFTYEVSVELKRDKIVITTDEIEVSAFLKLLIDKGARVEVYSRHFYPDPDSKQPDSEPRITT